MIKKGTSRKLQNSTIYLLFILFSIYWFIFLQANRDKELGKNSSESLCHFIEKEDADDFLAEISDGMDEELETDQLEPGAMEMLPIMGEDGAQVSL